MKITKIYVKNFRNSKIDELIDFMKTPRSMDEIRRYTGRSLKTIYYYFKEIEWNGYGLIDKFKDENGIIRYKIEVQKNKNVIEKAFIQALKEFTTRLGFEMDSDEEKTYRTFTRIFIKHLREVSCEKIEYTHEHTIKILPEESHYDISRRLFAICPADGIYTISLPGICMYADEHGVKGFKPDLILTQTSPPNFKYLMQHIQTGYPYKYADIYRLLQYRDILYDKMYSLTDKIWRRARKLGWKVKPTSEDKQSEDHHIGSWFLDALISDKYEYDYMSSVVYRLYRGCLNPEDLEFKKWYDRLEKKENIEKVLDEKLTEEALETKKIEEKYTRLYQRVESFVSYLKDIKRYGGILKGECDICRTYKIKFYE